MENKRVGIAKRNIDHHSSALLQHQDKREIFFFLQDILRMKRSLCPASILGTHTEKGKFGFGSSFNEMPQLFTEGVPKKECG